MNMIYQSTRNNKESISASKAILKGLAEDGGLYVPTVIPKFEQTLEELKHMTYQELAFEIMKLYFTDFEESELRNCIEKAYDDKFDTEQIAPLVKLDNTYYLELFHGPTIAFKDMALSILPHLLTTSAKKNNIEDEIVILTATSGDTGKAALAGFANVDNTKIIVFYPKDGVSLVQEKQMTTQIGENTYVVAVEGNFDDAQTGVKNMFNNRALNKELQEKGYIFSSANSINIGRLIPQVVYYVYAYLNLLKNEEIFEGEKIDVAVPTGNFGNILAAYYAKTMGLPIDKLICASNDNKVLYDFIETGVYDKNREFILTSSPSMDILISSNLERLVYQLTNSNSNHTLALMNQLSTAGKYELSDEMKMKLEDFIGGYATEEEVANTIKSIYTKTGYVIDTHTAVAAHVYSEYEKNSVTKNKCLITSTASPYKFAKHVMTAIDEKYSDMNEITLVDELSTISNTKLPQAIEEIKNAKVLHNKTCHIEEMESVVRNILK